MASDGADAGRKFEPPKPELEFMARITVDLVAPAWELGVTLDGDGSFQSRAASSKDRF
jgi:hypothetical protein